jgi:formate dehydrogenase iron-sulfur subunit
VIDPRSVKDYRDHDGYKGLQRALALTSDEILADVTASGLRGRGGAGFPTGIKWKTVALAQADRKYIVCNADEGDSGTFADRMIMEGDPFVVIEGMTIAGIAVGATKGYIYIRSEYPHAVAAMNAAIAAARRTGYLGEGIVGSSHTFDLEVRVGAGAYVCGEETSLLESLEGRRGIVRAKPPLPAHKGLFGRPTVINNVLSFAASIRTGPPTVRNTRSPRCRFRRRMVQVTGRRPMTSRPATPAASRRRKLRSKACVKRSPPPIGRSGATDMSVKAHA